MGQSLTGKVAVIAGAGGALGSALATRFAAEGAEALVLGDRRPDEVTGVADTLREGGSRVEVRPLDVRDGDDVDRLVEHTVERFGRIDVMVNNAGVLARNARIHNLTAEDWRDSLDVNVVGTFNGMRAAVRAMRPTGAGSIINTASVSALTAWPYAAPYCATKAAVLQMTKVAAVEYAAEGIRVNCVCPGFFRSAIHTGIPDEALQAIVDRHPVGRAGQATDVVGAFVYLAGDDSAFVTGTALVVDGGYSAP